MLFKFERLTFGFGNVRPAPIGDRLRRLGQSRTNLDGLVTRQDSTGGKQKLGPFPSRATATCDAFLWSGHVPCCGGDLGHPALPRDTNLMVANRLSCCSG